ncbi:MAG: Kelch repeat-containing protein [Egibacteraceae bacterium]
MCPGLRLASLVLIVGLASGCAAPAPAGKGAVPGGAWSPRAQAPLALTEVAAAPIAGQIWVAGGFNAQGQAVNSVQVYGPERNTWTAGPALPEPVHHSALVSADNELYLLGGYVDSSFRQPTAAVRRFDTATLRWVDAAPLPQPRAAGAAAWDGKRIVYAGGVGPDGLAGEVYALEGGAWRSVGDLSRPREHLAAASDGQGQVWLLGGREGSLERNLATVDLVEGGGVRPLGQLPTARGGVAAFWSAATGACLAGGEEPTGTLGAVECIDASGAVVGLPSLSRPRHGLGAAVVDGVAYVLLGGSRPGLSVSGTVEALPLKR